MAEMKFDGGTSGRRSMALPIVLALLILIALGAWFAKVYVHAAVTGSVDRVGIFPLHVEYKRGPGILVGANQTEEALYVVADAVLNDKSENPLFVKNMTGTLTMEDGTVMQADAIDMNDLDRLQKMFPQVKALAAASGTPPLTRETTVPTGQIGRGWAVFVYNVPQSVWDKRKAADMTVEFYHQDPVKLALPK